MKIQFNVRTLLVLTLFIAVLVAWWVDRNTLQGKSDIVTNRVMEMKAQNRELKKQFSMMKQQMEKKYGTQFTHDLLFNPSRVR